ncbi:MAG: EscU/YscU/HrcU family type III secretion system export apparatus switch protein [Oleiphilaceae bacterium]|nr:EscU/YscU/HrcU family type III secretion system export apparatus switch protein [Oleiphilaceae bacterium]
MTNDFYEEPEKTSRETAVALKYDGKRAPTIAASGRDDVASEIIKLAREHGVPLYENPELATILARLELDEEIPDTLYRVIAEILAFAFNLQGKAPADAGAGNGQ